MENCTTLTSQLWPWLCDTNTCAVYKRGFSIVTVRKVPLDDSVDGVDGLFVGPEAKRPKGSLNNVHQVIVCIMVSSSNMYIVL